MGCVILFCHSPSLPYNYFSEAVPFDVVILLESSDDLRSIDFGIERNFALDLLELFWGNNTRMGFYTFGGATKQHFALDTYTDLSDLKFVIRSTPYSKGNGESLEDAMVYVVENAFSAGGRLCIPNVLVVLTHTGLSGISGASSLQETIRAFGVNLLVIDLEENGEYHDFGDLDDNRTLIYRTKEIPTLGEVSSVLVNYVEGRKFAYEFHDNMF